MAENSRKTKGYTTSAMGSAANFITSTTSTANEIMSGSIGSNEVTIYRCGRCNQPIGKHQKKCYNCGANIDWTGVK